MDRATATSGAAMRYWAWADVGVEMQGGGSAGRGQDGAERRKVVPHDDQAVVGCLGNFGGGHDLDAFQDRGEASSARDGGRRRNWRSGGIRW